MQRASTYEIVIGLEVHAQLSTATKLFCADSVEFGAAPNTLVSPVSLGHPGTLPRTNKKAVAYAVKMGLACGCEIRQQSFFARKNYFYPDLPKGYQVSQHSVPICSGGVLPIVADGVQKMVRLNRIHLEEDAGKSIHDQDPEFTLLDFNRAGTALIEIVTEPCIHSAEEAYQYMVTVRKLVRWLGICDGNMEEGSLRCDANISVRPGGTKRLGTRVEVKNLNSTRHLRKAIELEAERLTGMLERGETIKQETRGYDAATNSTYSLRDKEDADDYRYFPDPDLAPVALSADLVAEARNALPALPWELESIYRDGFGLSAYDARQLTEERETTLLFEALTAHSKNYKAVANWIIGPLRQMANEQQLDTETIIALAPQMGSLVSMVEAGRLSFSVAATQVLPDLLHSGDDPEKIAAAANLLQVNDIDEVEKWVDQALENLSAKVLEYRKGKKGLLGLFVGEVKKLSGGKADPRLVTEVLENKLNNKG